MGLGLGLGCASGVRITTDDMDFHVCGKNHTGVVSTKYMRPVKVFGKNHTRV